MSHPPPPANQPNLHGSKTQEDAAVSAWEAAYARFETPAEEIAKFTKRLVKAGAEEWDKNQPVLELFCGRGNGLRALAGLGFTDLTGVDISADLLKGYDGPGKTVEADCRRLPLPDACASIVVVQGGLHHLPGMPGDLKQTLAEIHRVLRRDGHLFLVEPWSTPFLKFAHAMCFQPLVRKGWAKADALATMIEHERFTYDQWLNSPAAIREILHEYFVTESCRLAWGKITWLGKPRPNLTTTHISGK